MTVSNIPQFSFALMSGGEGRRFGSDKTKALLMGKPLYSYGLELGLSLTDDVMLVSRNSSKYEPFWPCVAYLEDELPVQCPMAGMITAALRAKYPRVFVLSADAPLFTAELVKAVASRLGEHDAVIPSLCGKSYNLAAAYSKNMLLSMKQCYDLGDYRLTNAYKNKDVIFIDVLSEEGAEWETEAFSNINTQEDIKKAELILKASEGKRR